MMSGGSQRSRTSLTPYAGSMRDPDPEGQRRAARELWHRAGVITIFPGDLRGIDRDFINAFASRVYGIRQGSGERR